MPLFRRTIDQIITQNAPFTSSKESTLGELIPEMRKHKIGSVIITENDQVIGIFTERDFLNKIPEDNSWRDITLADVMVPNPKTIRGSMRITDAIRMMRAGGFRHLVVVNDEGLLTSVISVKDIINHISDWLSEPSQKAS